MNKSMLNFRISAFTAAILQEQSAITRCKDVPIPAFAGMSGEGASINNPLTPAKAGVRT